jgi:signal transduction histidine kinase
VARRLRRPLRLQPSQPLLREGLCLSTEAAEASLGSAVWHGLLAHDLKNALGLLEGQLDALRIAPDAERASLAHRQCRELRQRLVAMLTVSRGEVDGGLQAWPTDEDPLSLLRAVAESARGLRPELDIDIDTIDTDASPPFGLFDAHLVRLALDAAMHNALRFAHQRITLRVQRQGSGLGLRWQVQDDGMGPGGEPAWTPSGIAPRSTGIGMALCRAVAQAHRLGDETGSVALRALNPGASFELSVP